MNIVSYKGFAAAVEYDAEDKILAGRIAGINDVIGFHAESATDVEKAFREAVDDYLETCAKIGKAPEKPYSGNMMLRVDPRVHAQVALAAQLTGKSINQIGEEALRAAAETLVQPGNRARHAA